MAELFSIFLNVITPVFLLVLIGYVTTPRLGIDARSLSKVAYYLLAPAFLFNIFRDAALEATLALRMGLFTVLVASGCVLVGILIARLLKQGAKMVAAFALVAAFGNVGNFGLPIIQFKLGEDALVVASFYFLILSIYGFMVGVLAASWHKGNGIGALFAVVKTPAILAVIPAVAVNVFDLPVPLFLQRGVGLLAAAMIPIMLLTLGSQLSGIRRPTINRNVIIASMLRLIIGPILAFALAAPFALHGLERGAGILQASMPAAVLAALVALEHDLLPDFVTTTVLFSTIASAFTLTLVLALL